MEILTEIQKQITDRGLTPLVLDWFNKRLLKAENPTLNQAEHILDWIIATNPPKLAKMRWDEVLKSSEKWTKTEQKKGSHIEESKDDTKLFMKIGEFKIVQLIGENAFKREGHLMSHCVASYYGKTGMKIYSLRDSKNEPHCTFEVVGDKDVQQVKGKGNGTIHPNYINAVVEFLEKIGMEVRDSEMKNLGYMNIEKHVKYLNKESQKSLFRKKYWNKKDKLSDKDGNEFSTFDFWDEMPLVTKVETGLKINFELEKFFKLSFDFLWNQCKKIKSSKKGDSSTAASSGDYSKAASSGDYSTAASSGDYSKAASSGDYSTAASSGYYSKAASSGDYSKAASSGYSSKAASSGYSSTAASSGDSSKAASSGNYSKAASSGNSSTAASSGDYSKAASSGNSSTAASSGDYSTAASSGNYSTAASSGYSSTAASSGYSSTAASSGNYSKAASSGYSSTAASSGDSSKAASSGDYSKAASSGYSSTAASSGYSSTAASSGYSSTAASSGNYSKAASSGDYSKAASSGNYSKAASSGDSSTAEAKGDETIACALGIKTKAKGWIGTWLVLTEYKEIDNKWRIIAIESIKVDGKEIKEDTWYQLKDKKFVEVK